jgi:hypothetical protein
METLIFTCSRPVWVNMFFGPLQSGQENLRELGRCSKEPAGSKRGDPPVNDPRRQDSWCEYSRIMETDQSLSRLDRTALQTA